MSNLAKQFIYATPFFIFVIYIIVVVGANGQLFQNGGLEIAFQSDWFFYSLACSLILSFVLFKLLKKYQPRLMDKIFIIIATIGALSYSLYGTIEFINYKYAVDSTKVKTLYLGAKFRNNDGGDCFYIINTNNKKVSNQAMCKKSIPNLREGAKVHVDVGLGYFGREWITSYKIEN